MIRVVHCTFTASAHIAAQNNAPELLDELAELAARAEVMAQHPGFAANTMRQLGLYCIPSIYRPELVDVIAVYGYSLIRFPHTT